MSVERTAQESRAENISAMGHDLGVVYSALWQQVASIYSNWDQFNVLYGTKEERVELLNQAAPAFFRLIQDVLWENVVLHIARLTDSPSSMGKPNLSVKRLPSLVSDELRTEIETLVADCLEKSEFARDWRNRHLAHRDLSRATAVAADPLKPASRAHVRDVLDSLTSVLNAVALHYKGSTSFFDRPESDGGARHLLYVLHNGVKADKTRRERLREGRPHLGDLDAPSL